MTRGRFILAGLVIAALGAGLIYLGLHPASTPGASPATMPEAVLRLGLIPERDIFQQRRAYKGLADYLQTKLNCRVELVTNNTYEGILQDFREGHVDAAFMGSLVAALTVDRFGAQVLLKSESANKVSTYAGVIFVPESSPARSFADLRGKSVGAVPTTTSGAVFPIFLEEQAHMSPSAVPRIVWSGTHDDVIREVVAGHLDAGSVKDTRLDAYEREHPEVKFRRLAASQRVPDNALVVRGDVAEEVRERLRLALLAMSDDSMGGGPAVQAPLGVNRYVPCAMGEYGPLYDMLDEIGPRWDQLQIAGPAPRRPVTRSTRSETQ